MELSRCCSEHGEFLKILFFKQADCALTTLRWQANAMAIQRNSLAPIDGNGTIPRPYRTRHVDFTNAP